MTPVWIACAVIVDGAAALIGGLLPDRWLAAHRAGMLGFASGALITAAMVDFFPAALAAAGPSACNWVLGAMIVLALVDGILAAHGHADHHGESPVPPRATSPATPYTLLTATTLHNLTDGMAIAAAFLVSTRVGIVAALAVIVHEVPKETADYAVLRASAIGKRRSLIALLCVQMAAGVGALLTLLGEHATGANGPVLALSTGTFLYIALVELLPDVVHHSGGRERVEVIAALIAGCALVAAATH